VVRDWHDIKDSGELVVLTLYSSTSYFNYRGEEMGFQYELSRQLADSLHLRLRVEVAHNVRDLIAKLDNGDGDLIAYPVPITKNRKDSLLFCGEEVVTHQVIVQRRGTRALEDVTELIGKEVHVLPGKYAARLANLNEELGGGINIRTVSEDSTTIEDLITRVSRGEIDYTVCDNDVARLNKTYYPNLDIALAISYDQRSSWAVRKTSPELAEIANRWTAVNQTSPVYSAITKRYFEISKAVPYTAILSLREGIISRFDALFRKYAAEIGWDWRLMAALAYTESNFDPTVVSWAGAVGLMQLMPATARAMGVPAEQEFDPESSVKGAAAYIRSVSRSLAMITDPVERIPFILAAYNGGLGHVYDAMALAEKYGKNKYVWSDNVEKYILLKSDPHYFNDPVCRYGYFRGIETYNFVRDIRARSETYTAKIVK
jgi:membrane-bound lytic murein transglycosylase F